MNTYDTGASTHGKAPLWRSLRALIRRWLDRERELVALRNAVGMMAEARRADAREYHDMVDALRQRRAEIDTLAAQVSTLQARLAHVEAPAASAWSGKPLEVAELIPRIDAAIRRIVAGDASMRVPAESTDPDLVLADCRRLFATSGVKEDGRG
jgi:hypothetical protein